MIDKFVASPEAALADVPDGATIMIHGFGNAGMPAALIDALIAQGAKDLTIVNNNAGNADTGLAALIGARRVRKILCSFPRQADSWHFDRLYRAGEIELELVPQGTLAERIRAAGAASARSSRRPRMGRRLAEGETRRIGDATTCSSIRSTPTTRSSGRPRRPLGQPHLPQERAQLRPDHGDGGEVHSGAGARDGRAGRRPGGRRHAGNLRPANRACGRVLKKAA